MRGELIEWAFVLFAAGFLLGWGLHVVLTEYRNQNRKDNDNGTDQRISCYGDCQHE